ncbi:MAG: sodium:proton antiporter [Martelella sp.]|uniref:cation:proton antiporter n=1 Tax=Martelella sp. TaxID=1969699 RepID=UPI00324242E7
MLTPFEVIAILLSATAIFSWFNLRTVTLPNTIALLLLGLLASLSLLVLDRTLPANSISATLENMLQKLNFENLVMHGLLPFLLFAGALQVDVEKLYHRWVGVGSLATIGVFVSAIVVAAGLWGAASLLAVPLSFAWCFVFGALIAPTDPVAMLAVLKSIQVPESLKVDLTGETLFNDGIGVVLFILALRFATGGDTSLGSVAGLFFLEAGGGAFLGLAVGYAGYHALKSIDDYAVEIVISLGVVTATYAIADRIGVSGPISVVVAGVLLGHRGRQRAMSRTTRNYLFGFWQLIDHVLNSVLFLLIGLETVTIGIEAVSAYLAIAAVAIVIFARFVAVSGAVLILNTLTRVQSFPRGSVVVLTWGAVRGAIPVALALSLPEGNERPYILAATYATVLFSVVVQALTLRRVVVATVPGSEQ